MIPLTFIKDCMNLGDAVCFEDFRLCMISLNLVIDLGNIGQNVFFFGDRQMEASSFATTNTAHEKSTALRHSFINFKKILTRAFLFREKL